MSVRSGFYNSKKGDRSYFASDMSNIFEGIINDGVFMNIGNLFAVGAVDGSTKSEVSIDSGKGWLNKKWIENDAIVLLSLPISDLILDRWDAVVLDTNYDDSVRDGVVTYVMGVPSANPAKPTMTNDEKHKQMPLAYIYRTAGVDAVTQSNITNCVGTNDCPYITGILETADIDNLVAQWGAQWDDWTSEQQTELMRWIRDLNVMLSGDAATKLANDITVLNDRLNELATEHTMSTTIFDSNGNLVKDNGGGELGAKHVAIFEEDMAGYLDPVNAKIDELSDNLNSSLNGLTIKALTQTEYDALTTKDTNTLYFTYTA